MTKYTDMNLVDLQYCKVLAFAFSDRSKEARDALSEIVIWRYKTKREADIIYMLNVICLASRILDDEDLFQENYITLGTLLKKHSSKDSYVQAASDYYARVSEKLDYLNHNDYESLIRLVRSQEASLGNKLAQVMLEYEKAEYLEKVGDFEGVRRSLEFVIEYGNRLNYVAKAEERLNILESKKRNLQRM